MAEGARGTSGEPLPVEGILPRLLAALRESGAAVLVAPPGSGKTTRVPPAILDSGVAGGGRVIVLEPRRIAARAAARRIAAERRGRVGDEIGYRVRFESVAGPSTRLEFVTEGVLLRMLADDPYLERAGAVVFDEFHERSLFSDLALALVARLRREARPDLRIVAMSATLDPGPVAAFLSAESFHAEGRAHPVAIEHLAAPDSRPLPDRAAAGVRAALARVDGDVLCFLPGAGEIRATADRLAGLAAADVVPLFGDLPAAEQDRALAAGPRRRVVLATNVAETSVTVEGVAAVVDLGLARIPRFDPATGLSRLALEEISKAAADQRAGRAGRLGPGLCLRMWTEREHRARPDRETPGIRREDLAGAVLALLAGGEPDPAAFPFFEAPEPERLAAALSDVAAWGAVRDGRITPVGREMAALPVHPRLARLLVEGRRRGVVRRAALAAALLSERDPFRGGSGPPGARHDSESDVLDRVQALEEFAAAGRPRSELGEISPGAARFLLRAADQLARAAGGGDRSRGESADDPDEALLRAVHAAWADRLAKRRAPGSPRAVRLGGSGVVLDRRSAVLTAELFVAVEVEAAPAGGGDARVRMASAVRREWLDPERIVAKTDVFFDPEGERVAAVRRVRYGDLALEESAAALPADADVAGILARAAAERLDRALDLSSPALAELLARIAFLKGAMPELGLPDRPEAILAEMLPALAAGRRSFAELRAAPLADFVLGGLTPAQRDALARHAPERIETPSGSRIRLVYESGRPPVMAVRIQEMFGLAETPRVAAGRVPVLLHLLAPNHRPQQVTDDLASFWANTWPRVRKELRARYPRHAWPEDPLSAAPPRHKR